MFVIKFPTNLKEHMLWEQNRPKSKKTDQSMKKYIGTKYSGGTGTCLAD